MTGSSPSSAGSTYISQGEHAVGSIPDNIISTILGSCVATCLYDPVAKVGGMNHFLLPDAGGHDKGERFGAHAMEILINAMIRKGADRRRFRAKVFGGANLRAGLTNAGAQNAHFVLDYLEREGIPCEGQSLGGNQARRVEFWPYEGRARQKLVTDTSVREEPVVAMPTPSTGGLELF